MVPWAWGMNGAFSVVGATLAIFIAMNWGFQITLFAASATYLIGACAPSSPAKRVLPVSSRASDATALQARRAAFRWPDSLAGSSRRSPDVCDRPSACER